MLRKCAIIGLLVLTLHSPLSHGQPADRCGDILRYGVFDVNYLKTTHEDYRLFQHALCSSSSSQDTATLGALFNALTPNGTFAGQWNAASTESRKSMLCRNDLTEMFTKTSLESFVQTASPVIVDAWQKCMTPNATAKLSARYTDDLKDVALFADSGIANLNLAFYGKKDWRDQLTIVPIDALTCSGGFAATQPRDTITCKRSDRSLDQPVFVTLKSQYGAQQPQVELPSRHKTEVLTQDAYLSAQLELPPNSFQAVAYMPLVSKSSIPYSHGVNLASQEHTASVITYRIPLGAKTFKGAVIAYTADCYVGGGLADGWVVVISVPGRPPKRFDMHWYHPDEPFEIPVDQLPAGSAREVSISVDPIAARTCDHSGLGDPRFTPAHPGS